MTIAPCLFIGKGVTTYAVFAHMLTILAPKARVSAAIRRGSISGGRTRSA